MKHKVNKKVFRRTLALILVMTMLVTGHNLNVKIESVYATQKVQKTEDNGENKGYIIVAKNEKAYNRALNAIDEESIESGEKFIDNNIIVAELSEQEAEELNQDSNIIIEKNLVLEASKVKSGSKSKKELYKQLKKDRKRAKEKREAEWNLQAINVDEVDTKTDIKDKVKIAVLDSGIDFISGMNLVKSVNFVDTEEYVAPYYQDLTGHGTNVASVIVGDGKNIVQGVNPNAELYSVKVLDENNQAPISRIIEGIYWCIENNMNIINMSFGTPTYSKVLEKAVKDAYDANILMVAASGNKDSDVEYPAAFEKVMAVAATNTKSEISDFSNTGEELDVAAPGEKVRVLGFFGMNGVTHGTSIAVPQVVGVASLLWERDLTKSNEFIRQLINYSSKNIENTNDCGLLDAEYALQIYDEFDDNFGGINLASKEHIPENDEVLEIFDEIVDDSAYVEGRWVKTRHQDLVTNGAKNDGLTTTELKILKAGAIYPDEAKSGMNGLDDNAEYHGGYMDLGGNDTNYIACYEFVTRIALNNGNASTINRSTIKGLGQASYEWIKWDFEGEGVGAVTWNKIFSDLNVSNTNKNKKYFTWGIALHILSDTFAHKTYRKSDNKLIVHEDHYTNPNTQIPGADVITVVKGRWLVAGHAVDYSIDCLLTNNYGDCAEIINALEDQTYTSNSELFLKKRLSQYVQSNGGTVTSYVRNANYN
jgi:minor extracellular protease Epr